MHATGTPNPRDVTQPERCYMIHSEFIPQVGMVVRMTQDDPGYGYKAGDRYIITDRASLDEGYSVQRAIRDGSSAYLKGKKVGLTETSNAIYLQVRYMAPDMDNDLEGLEKAQKQEKAALDLTTEKIAYMKKYKLDKFDQRKFDLYRALNVVEAKGTNAHDKAEAIARIFPA